MLNYIDLSEAPVELIVEILMREPSALGKLALINTSIRDASLSARLQLACQRMLTKKEIEHYQAEYSPLARCEFMERAGDYEGVFLHHCSYESERYQYINASGFGTVMGGNGIGVITDSPMFKLGTDDYGECIYTPQEDVSLLGHDLVTSYHVLSERIVCPGFAKCVVLNTLKDRRRSYEIGKFYVYTRCNAMVAGITSKHPGTASFDCKVHGYYNRVKRYLENLDDDVFVGDGTEYAPA